MRDGKQQIAGCEIREQCDDELCSRLSFVDTRSLQMTNKTSRDRFSAASKRHRAVQLRLDGRSLQDIGDALGVSRQMAWKYVREELQRVSNQYQESIGTMVQLELERLDAILMGIWGQASSGHLGAIDRVLKIMDRRARLTGLDAPAKIAHTDPTGTVEATGDIPQEISDEELEARIRELERKDMDSLSESEIRDRIEDITRGRFTISFIDQGVEG